MIRCVDESLELLVALLYDVALSEEYPYLYNIV
jgi:hypothetical protein